MVRTYKSHIAQGIAAIALIISLLLPAVVNFVHSAEGHDHRDNCENPSDKHVHKKKLDCSLYDVTLKNNGVFTFVNDLYFTIPEYILEETHYEYTIYRTILSTKESRGPPYC